MFILMILFFGASSGAAEDKATCDSCTASLVSEAYPLPLLVGGDSERQLVEQLEQLEQLADELGAIQERIQAAADGIIKLTEASSQWVTGNSNRYRAVLSMPSGQTGKGVLPIVMEASISAALRPIGDGGRDLSDDDPTYALAGGKDNPNDPCQRCNPSLLANQITLASVQTGDDNLNFEVDDGFPTGLRLEGRLSADSSVARVTDIGNDDVLSLPFEGQAGDGRFLIVIEAGTSAVLRLDEDGKRDLGGGDTLQALAGGKDYPEHAHQRCKLGLPASQTTPVLLAAVRPSNGNMHIDVDTGTPTRLRLGSGEVRDLNSDTYAATFAGRKDCTLSTQLHAMELLLTGQANVVRLAASQPDSGLRCIDFDDSTATEARLGCSDAVDLGSCASVNSFAGRKDCTTNKQLRSKGLHLGEVGVMALTVALQDTNVLCIKFGDDDSCGLLLGSGSVSDLKIGDALSNLAVPVDGDFDDASFGDLIVLRSKAISKTFKDNGNRSKDDDLPLSNRNDKLAQVYPTLAAEGFGPMIAVGNDWIGGQDDLIDFSIGRRNLLVESISSLRRC